MTSYNIFNNFTNSSRDHWSELQQIGTTIVEDYAIAFEKDPAAGSSR